MARANFRRAEERDKAILKLAKTLQGSGTTLKATAFAKRCKTSTDTVREVLVKHGLEHLLDEWMPGL